MMAGDSSRETEEEVATSQLELARDSRLEKCARLWRRRTARDTWRPWAMMLTRMEARATTQPQPPSG